MQTASKGDCQVTRALHCTCKNPTHTAPLNPKQRCGACWTGCRAVKCNADTNKTYNAAAAAATTDRTTATLKAAAQCCLCCCLYSPNPDNHQTAASPAQIKDNHSPPRIALARQCFAKHSRWHNYHVLSLLLPARQPTQQTHRQHHLLLLLPQQPINPTFQQHQQLLMRSPPAAMLLRFSFYDTAPAPPCRGSFANPLGF